MKQIEDDMKELKQSTTVNTEAIKVLEKKVEEATEAAKKADMMSKEEFEARMREEEEERRERRARELNVIIHGIDECRDDRLGGEERMQYDMEQCVELFSVMELGVAASELKFCRRVGTKGEKDRPLVVGLYNERTRGRILRADWKSLEPEVSVGPDLTKRQREDEAQVWKDMEDRNSRRTAEERAKNLAWRVVGPKGERRLVLGQARELERGGARGTSRWTGRATVRGAATTRGAASMRGAATVRGAAITRGAPAARRATGAWRSRIRAGNAGRGAGRAEQLLPPPAGAGGVWRPVAGEEEEQETASDSSQTVTGRTRISSKRKEREDDVTMQEEDEEETGEPPAKH
jgi:hypothetical protein